MTTLTRKTLTVEEAGEVLGLSRSASFAAAKRGDIPTIRIGRRILVPITALDRMLAEKPFSNEKAAPRANVEAANGGRRGRDAEPRY